MADSKDGMTDQRPAPLVEPRTNGTPRPAAAPGHTRFDDIRMEQMMGLLLRFGVILASTVVLAGGVFYMQDHTGQRVEYRNFVAHPVSLRHPGELLSGMARGDATAIIEVGILLLIATPIARVAFAVVSFAIERDRLYVAIGLTVLAVLLYGMFRTG
jgi:uncharacterized membrane protein